MVTYQKLPASTPKWLTYSLLVTGGFLGYSIGICALVALYGLFGFLANFFYPGSFTVSPSEAAYLGVLGIVAVAAAVVLGFLAYFMNGLSKKSVRIAKIAWMPVALTAALAWLQLGDTTRQYHLNVWWCIGVTVAIVLGGLVPAWLLGTTAGRKLHNK